MSLFTSKKKKKDNKGGGGSSASEVMLGTGGHVDELVVALCAHANDSSVKVKRTITNSLLDIGRHQPDLVISASLDFLLKNNNAPTEHRILLLKVIEKVLEVRRDQIEEDLAAPLFKVAMGDMTRSKDVSPDWQGQASTVLVSVGMRWPDTLMKELMERFSPGSIPHYFILKTLGDFAVAYPLAVVPHLKGCLARVIPVLGLVKQDNLKWVFASTLGKFCDAIVSYVANVKAEGESSPYPKMEVQDFSGEVFPAYELLFTNWVPSREVKVRTATIQAVGSMCAVLTTSQFESQLSRLLTGILALYKKDKDHLPLTMGLCVILEVAIKDESRMLEPHLNNLLTALHHLSCLPVDMTDANAIKNNNELMRCIEILGKVFSEEVIHFLLGKLDPKICKSAHLRAGTLRIFKHIVTRLERHMEGKKGLLVSGIQPSLKGETSLEVKKALAQLIIVMASHDYLSEEGGQTCIEFIVKGCSMSQQELEASPSGKEKAAKNADAATPQEFRDMCDSILNLVSTTIPCMQKVMWPFILEFLVSPQYTEAIAIIFKSAAHLAKVHREASEQNEDDDQYWIDFERLVNLPKPAEILARLLVLLCVPLRRSDLGTHALNCLHSLGPLIREDVATMWDQAIPKLHQYLKTNGGDKWDAKAWSELILRLLSESLKLAQNEEWAMSLGNALETQLSSYNQDPELKKACILHMGLVLQKLTKKDFIRAKLESLLDAVQHTNELERQGCAQALGYCGAAHLDMVLDIINGSLKKFESGKGNEGGGSGGGGGGFLSFFSSSSSSSGGGSSKKAAASGGRVDTCLLAFGFVTAYAPPSLITNRIDVHIINPMKPFMEKAVKLKRKECIVKSLELIGKAMNPSHLGGPYMLKQRNDLLKQLLAFLTVSTSSKTSKSSSSSSSSKSSANANEVTNELRGLILNTCTSFILLEPRLTEEVEAQLLQTACSVITLPAEPSAGLSEVYSKLDEVFAAALSMDPTVVCMDRIFRVLESYTRSPDALQRERAVSSFLFILKKFVELRTGTDLAEKLAKLKQEAKWEGVGRNLAALVPRCTDPKVEIRHKAVEAVGIMMYIDFMLQKNAEQKADKQKEEGDTNNATAQLQPVPPPNVLRPLNTLKTRAGSTDINEQYRVMQDMCAILAEMLSLKELLLVLEHLLPGLTDSQLTSASGACIVLNGLITRRGEELEEQVPSIVSTLLQEMKKIKQESTLHATLHAVRNLALHHTLPVIEELLNCSLPHEEVVIKSFQVIGKDKDLVMVLVSHLTDILNHSLLYDQKGDKTPVPKHLPMAATCALGEIMQTKELAAIVEEHYAQFLCTLLLRFGTTNGTNEALGQAIFAFKQFVECAKEETLSKVLDSSDIWAILKTPEYYRAITKIINVLGGEHKDKVYPIYEFIYPFLKGNYQGHRVVSAAVVAELINFTNGDTQLLDKLVNALLFSLSDPVIKLQALKGLGNIVSAGKDEVDRYAATILDALVSCVDSADEGLCMASMDGLAKVFELIDEGRVAPILVNLCQRIRPAFENPKDEIRSSAFTLFGTLSRFGQYSTAVDPFFEQIHHYLPSLVLHMNDPCNAVVEACKKTIRRHSKLMRASDIEEFMNHSALDPGSQLNYDEFLMEFAKLLIQDYPERMNYYIMTSIEFFKSHWTQLRGSAATFVGALLGQLPKEKRRMLNVGMITQALVALLRQKDADVRRRVAATMGLLHDY
ncbi:HEAT repeat domain containing protein [Balamuthia mandrillaris]